MAPKFSYNEGTEKLIRYWEKYHNEYVNLLPMYEELIKKKKELGLLLRNSKDSSILKGYPKIPFLEIPTRKAMLRCIDEMKPRQIENLIREIDSKLTPDCSCFNLMRRRVKYHKQDIKDQTRVKCYAPRLNRVRPAKE